jgi:hypothetical protein
LTTIPDLKDAVQRAYDEASQKIKEAFSTAWTKSEALTKLQDQFRQMTKNIVFPRVEMPNFEFPRVETPAFDMPAAWTAVDPISLAPPSLGPYRVADDALDIAARAAAERQEAEVDLQQEQLEVSIQQLEATQGVLAAVDAVNRRDMIDWLLVALAAVAAVTGVLALLVR